MKHAVVTTGISGNTFTSLFRSQINRMKPPVVGLAVAYVSVSGFNLVQRILNNVKVREVRLVTDIRDRVTHPKALIKAVDSGWIVRLVDNQAGTFHPKLYVGATAFGGNTGVKELSLAIIGSPNLSYNGFKKNGECVFWSVDPPSKKMVAKAWLDCWDAGDDATPNKLAEYERDFAERNRSRKPQDIVALGVADPLPAQKNGIPNTSVVPPKNENKAISKDSASVAWAGLQSFTGEYKFQVEFPKEAGLVLQRIVSDHTQDKDVNILCADGVERTFTFKFYPDNGMFRLNIPNDTPFVSWAREHKDGLAFVEYNEANGGLYTEILSPGDRLTDIVCRSLAFGTWGRTPTRLYGWY